MEDRQDETIHSDESSVANHPARSKLRAGKWLRKCVIVFTLLLVATWASLKAWQNFIIPADAPLIGASLDTAWHAQAGISTKNYEFALTRVGARITNVRPGREPTAAILDRIDGLLLTGGGDVDPELYGSESRWAKFVDRERDDFELALIDGAIKRNMPILGICRGIHILNVAYGGTIRNLREESRLSKTHGIGLNSMSAHTVNLEIDSRLGRIFGVEQLSVNSFHGQAVDRVAGQLRAVARSPDGVVEALELPGDLFVVTMQWHPEVPKAQLEVWEAFYVAAKEYRRLHPK